jgi:hypothetical protein
METGIIASLPEQTMPVESKESAAQTLSVDGPDAGIPGAAQHEGGFPAPRFATAPEDLEADTGRTFNWLNK